MLFASKMTRNINKLMHYGGNAYELCGADWLIYYYPYLVNSWRAISIVFIICMSMIAPSLKYIHRQFCLTYTPSLQYLQIKLFIVHLYGECTGGELMKITFNQFNKCTTRISNEGITFVESLGLICLLIHLFIITLAIAPHLAIQPD